MLDIMEALTEQLPNWSYVLTTTVVVFLVWRSRTQQNLKRYLDPHLVKETVLLHQYGKASTVPSISPFVMKLETYLRAANISYINKFSRQPGSKGKLPWIQYNDTVVSDSQFCIQFLNREKNVNLNKKLKPEQLAIGHLVRRTAEESLYWIIILWRLIFEKSGIVYKRLGIPSFIIWIMRKKARTASVAHGIGRHSQEEVTQIMDDDLAAVSQILGEKNFLFGDNVGDVTEFDCALFGQLCQLIWQMPGTSLGKDIADKFPNLVEFCERMKAAFWPDWDQRIQHPTTEHNDKPNGQHWERIAEKSLAISTKHSADNQEEDFTFNKNKSNDTKTLISGKHRIVTELNVKLKNSAIQSNQIWSSGKYKNNYGTARLRSVSASSILADKATILSSQ